MTSHGCFLLLALCLVGCASGTRYDEMNLREPTSGRGRIYFYRSASPLGVVVQPQIELNGQPVGNSVPGGFFYVDRPAGAYRVACSTEVNRSCSFQLDPGEVHFVKTAVRLGFFVGHVIPSLVNEDTARKQIASKRYTGEKERRSEARRRRR